jgi:hypothetical protein
MRKYQTINDLPEKYWTMPKLVRLFLHLGLGLYNLYRIQLSHKAIKLENIFIRMDKNNQPTFLLSNFEYSDTFN